MTNFCIPQIIFIFYLVNLSKQIMQDENEISQEFRGVWVSPWGGDKDLITFISKDDFIKKMTYILDLLKLYNMNTIIYHVRTHNDALYKSKYNPISPYFSEVDFNEFNPLEWMINESHKRGIDFHAWMNPYRIKSGNKTSKEEIISYYKNYNNPANDERCILNGTDSIILDPGLEKVRNFIIDTINEFLEKYDVDAIHFDDYFYSNMGAGGQTKGNITILDEPDQTTYEEYIDNNADCKYEKNNAEDKANWRRDQIDLLIKQIKDNIDSYNNKYDKKVQFGISPTGIYKNGDGKVSYDEEGNAITTGSDTKGQEHYASYLFCDTLKWINKGWINYILPQSYWSIDHPLAGYKIVMDWWDKVLEYKRVNLFSGIGLYMADSEGKVYGWKDNDNELYEHLTYSTQAKNIDGVSIYNFNTLRRLYDGNDTYSSTQIKNGIKAWNIKVPSSEIKSFEKIKLLKPNNLVVDGKIISFEKVEGAKFYVIYRNTKEILFKSEEIVDIFGDNNDIVTWEEKDEGKFNYGVKAFSYTNTLGEGASINNFNIGNYLSLKNILIIYLILLLFL